MKKVLIIRTGAIGDVVETTGLIRALKEKEYTIDYLTGVTPAELLQNDPDINKLYILQSKKYSQIFKISSKLSKEKYDLILNLQPSIRTTILGLLTKAKKIVNYKKSYKYHAVENFFETGKRAIADLELKDYIHLFIHEEKKQKMNNELENKTRICFNTSASKARQGRKWPIEYWLKLADGIFNSYDAQIFVIGSEDDIIGAKKLTEKFPQIKSFVGQTSILETAALLSNTNIVISGDTGPIHIASAVGPTCIGVYGSCPVSRSGPYGKNHQTVASSLNCSPCDKKICKYTNSTEEDTPCMKDIHPDDVLNLVDTILKKC